MLDKKAFGLSVGIIWGLGVFLTTLGSLYFGYLNQFFGMLTGMYPLYAVSLPGSLSGLIFGFIDGFVGGWLIAWLYNYFEAGKKSNPRKSRRRRRRR